MSNKVPPIVSIQAHGLPDAWHKAIKECIKHGAIDTRDYGKPVKTKVIISTIEIGNPLCEPMLHDDFPTRELHLREYIKQWERGYDWKKQGFEYNYMARLIGYPRTDIDSDSSGYYKIKQLCENTIDQIKVIRENIAKRIAKGGECYVSNRDQIITWVPERDLFVAEDQPCFDSETEVLTKDGWKFFKDVKNDDLITTLNKDGSIEYHCPINKIEYNYKGKMYLFEGTSIDFKVTPNHNMYVSDGKREFSLIQADDLYSHFYMKNTAHWKGVEQEYFILETEEDRYGQGIKQRINRKIPMDKWLKFLGIYLSDGYFYYKEGSNYKVAITQKEKISQYEEIVFDLEKFFPNISVYPDTNSYGCLHFQINDRDLCKYVSQFGKAHDKYVPDFIKNLSQRQIIIFLDAKSLRDSHMSGETLRYDTTSKRMADDLQELILKSGRGSGDIWKRQNKEYYEVKERKFANGKMGFRKDIQISDCDETVYCLEVPNNILLVRRHGKSIWCGNCMQRIQIFVYSYPKMDGDILIPGKGEFHVDWRSRDLYAAWNSNMVGLTLMLKREIFDPNNIKIIRCVDHCSSAHLYEGDWESAEKVKPVAIITH